MAELELPKHGELEELKQNTFTKRVALTTALFAVVLAIASLGGNNAMKHMLLAQQQASDQWTFYQAKAIREHQYRIQKLRLEVELAQQSEAMKPELRQKYETLLGRFGDEENRYAVEKKEIEQEAKRLEHERDVNRAKDPYFDFAEVLMQIAIVMASISILAGSRPVFVFSILVAVVGSLLTLNGFITIVDLPFLHLGH